MYTCVYLTGSFSSRRRLTTTMLMSFPIVPSLKRLETFLAQQHFAYYYRKK